MFEANPDYFISAQDSRQTFRPFDKRYGVTAKVVLVTEFIEFGFGPEPVCIDMEDAGVPSFVFIHDGERWTRHQFCRNPEGLARAANKFCFPGPKISFKCDDVSRLQCQREFRSSPPGISDRST